MRVLPARLVFKIIENATYREEEHQALWGMDWQGLEIRQQISTIESTFRYVGPSQVRCHKDMNCGIAGYGLQMDPLAAQGDHSCAKSSHRTLGHSSNLLQKEHPSSVGAKEKWRIDGIFSYLWEDGIVILRSLRST